MIVESVLYNKKEEYASILGSSKELSELSENQLRLLYFVLFVYVLVTLYVAIKYPISFTKDAKGINVFLSVLLAIFFSALFWFVKLVEVLIKSGKAQKTRKSGKRKSVKKSKYYSPIY